MKLTWEKGKGGNPTVPTIQVMILPDRHYGTVIGTNDNTIGVLLNTGEYMDVPRNRVRRIGR